MSGDSISELHTPGEVVAARALRLGPSHRGGRVAYAPGQAGASFAPWGVGIYSHVDDGGRVRALPFWRAGGTWQPLGWCEIASVRRKYVSEPLPTCFVPDGDVTAELERAYLEFVDGHRN